MIDCRLVVNGTELADTAADLIVGAPTALAAVNLTWGRDTTVDQPEAATVTAVLVDTTGGTQFTDRVWIGAPLELHAAGDISTGQGVNTFTDPSFETQTVGPVPKPPAATRFFVFGGSSADIIADAHAGTRGVLVHRPTATVTAINVAPAVFSDDPAAWDQIPRARTGEVWTLKAWCRTRTGPNSKITAAGKANPEHGPFSLTVSNTSTIPNDGAWHQFQTTLLVPPQWDQLWVGMRVEPGTPTTWEAMTGTWAATPDTWQMYGALLIDEAAAIAPATGLPRDALMFAGRITDLTARIDDDGSRHIELIAADQLAMLGNRWLGQLPWPAETVPARISRILAAAGVTAQTVIDTAFQTLTVAPMDVDNQSAATLLQELAAGIDAVLWTAAHATLGAYIRLLDLAAPPAGATILDACDLEREPVTWRIDVSDVITRVDVTWQDTSTTPPTERTEKVDDTPAIALYGVRRHGVACPLTTVANARWVGNRILARSSQAAWRTDDLARDLALIPDRNAAERATLLDLLDGTIRLDRHLQVTDVAGWLTGDLDGTLTGGRYTYGPDGWVLDLTIAPTPEAA